MGDGGYDFLERLSGHIATACGSLFDDWGVPELAEKVILEQPALREHGDISLNLAMVAAGPVGRAPRELAEEIVGRLEADNSIAPLINSFSVAGPGFINMFIQDQALVTAALEARERGEAFGMSAAAPENILLEYVSSNPTGPLHVGHARYAAYGDSLSRILGFAGHHVTTEFYINDYGTQMGLFGRSLAARYGELEGEHIPFPEEGYKGEYTTHVAELIRDEIGNAIVERIKPELSGETVGFFRDKGCSIVLDEVRAVLEAFRVSFDIWFSEATLYDDGRTQEVLEELTIQGEAEEREGALWLLTTRYGDDKDRVLVRTSGEPTYFASDIAYHKDKLSRGYDRLINIWGADHHGYVQRMKAAFEALSHDPERLEIIIGQLVNVIELGKKKQMSKRAGTLVTLSELLESIGVDAARFLLVDRSHDSTLDLDLEKAKLQSEENPVYYVQYAHARISSILRKAAEEGVTIVDSSAYESLKEEERDLILKLLEFPRSVRLAANTRAPNRITGYARELAATFHVFYHNCPVIRASAEVASFRLDLCLLTRNVIATCLDLVGVSAPESM